MALSEEEYAKLLNDLQQATSKQYGGQYDPTYDAAARSLMGDATQGEAGLQKNYQRTGENATQNLQNLIRQRGEGLQRNEQNMADRGILRSGANLVANQRLGDAFQRSVQGVETSRERALSDIAGQQSNLFSTIRGRLSQADASAAERARVRDEAQKFQQEQANIEAMRAAREEEWQRQQLDVQKQQADAFSAQLAAMQPQPTDTGSYASPNQPPDPYSYPEAPVATPVLQPQPPQPTYVEAQKQQSMSGTRRRYW